MIQSRADAETAWRAKVEAVAAGEADYAEHDCGSGSLARTLWAATEVPEGLHVDVSEERVTISRLRGR